MDRLLKEFERLKWRKRLGYLRGGHYIRSAEQHRLSYIIGFAVLLISLFFGPLLRFHNSYALTFTWDGGGTTNDWSDCANWTTDVCPGSGDTVTFNATSTKDATVDASFAGTINGFTISSGYTGTISLARSLTVNGTFSQGAGNLNSGSQALDFNSTFSLTAGAFTAPSTTMTVASTFTISGSSTFNANGGTVTFDSSTASYTCNNAVFNLITFTSSGTKTINSGCSFPLGNNPTIPAAVTLNGTLSGSGTLTLTSGTFLINSGASLSGFSGLVTNAFTIDTIALDLSGYSTLDVNSTFTLRNTATVTMPAVPATFANNFTLNSGTTFNANGGTVIFDGSAGTLSCNNAVFNVVSFQQSSTKTVNSDCNLPLGSNPNSTGGITLNGTLSGTGTLTANSLILNAGSILSGFSGLGISSGGFTLSGANFDAGSYSSFSDAGNFNLSSGAFTAPSGTMSLSKNLTITGGTFDANGGIVTFDGGTAILSCNNVAFNSVTVNKTATSASLTVNSDCNLPLGNNPTLHSATAGTRTFTLNGTLSGTGTLTSEFSTNTLTSSAVLSGFDGFVGNSLTQSGGVQDFGDYTTFDINTAFTLSSGAVFTAPSGITTVAGDFTISSGTTFNNNGGTVTFDGESSGTISCNNTVFNNVTFEHTLGQKVVTSDCTMPLGNDPILSAGVTLQGTFTGSGIITGHAGTNGAGRFQLDAGYNLVGFTGLKPFTLTITTTADLSNYQPLDISAAFNLNSGAAFIAPATMSVGGSLTFSAGSSFDANSGTLILNGAGNVTCNNAVFNLVVISHTTGLRQINAGCNLPLGNNPSAGAGGDIRLIGGLSGSGTLTTTGDFRIDDGYSLVGFNGLITDDFSLKDNVQADFGSFSTLDVNGTLDIILGSSLTAPSSSMSVAGDFTNDGTFNANGGTVVLDGGDQTISGNPITFHNLTKTVTSAATLTLPNGVDETVDGTLTFKGSSGQLLSLVSASPGTQWQITANGTRDLEYLDVSDSLNLSSTTLVACHSIDDGGNDGWSFNPSSCNPSSGGGASSSSSSSGGGSSSSSGSTSTTSGAGSTSSSNSAKSQEPTSQPSGSEESEQPSSLLSPVSTPVAVALMRSNHRWWWILSGLSLPLLGWVIYLLLMRRHSSLPPATGDPDDQPPTISPTV